MRYQGLRFRVYGVGFDHLCIAFVRSAPSPGPPACAIWPPLRPSWRAGAQQQHHPYLNFA